MATVRPEADPLHPAAILGERGISPTPARSFAHARGSAGSWRDAAPGGGGIARPLPPQV